jgi:hypothetical protein
VKKQVKRLDSFYRPHGISITDTNLTASTILRQKGIGRCRIRSAQRDAQGDQDLQFPFGFQLSASARNLSAANSIAFRVLLRASQASGVGSIPIARSVNPVDAVGLTGFPLSKTTSNRCILDVVGREIKVAPEFWTR